ncbi:MAG TPA: diacylglycerol kinase family protein [Rhizomicrobium sp.]|nr:diacylglycerol kinase family protein [Rhizomicrobium sp.]
MSAFVVVNPRSGNGRTAREWPDIERALRLIYGGLTVAHTEKRGQATGLVRNAIQQGYENIVAVGGDGTINEAVNGFFDEEGPIAPDTVFSFVTSGTGGDFRKSFGIEAGWSAGVARLANANVSHVDVGRVSCLSPAGVNLIRHFINIASFGLSGAVVDSVNRARVAKLFGGRFAFALHSAVDLLTYRSRPVRIRIDDVFDDIVLISTVAVANGRYFGAGMNVAPNARPDDGLFDIIVMSGAPRTEAMAGMKLLYTGEHLTLPHVRAYRGQTLTASPVEETRGRPVLIDLDGESGGRIPATFEILPGALRLRC